MCFYFVFIGQESAYAVLIVEINECNTNAPLKITSFKKQVAQQRLRYQSAYTWISCSYIPPQLVFERIPVRCLTIGKSN